MRPGRIALLFGILLAIAVPVGTTVLIRHRAPVEPATAPSARIVAIDPVVISPAVPPPIPSAAPEEQVPIEPAKTGWLKARLDPVPAFQYYSFRVVVYGPQRNSEHSANFDNVDRFDLGPLTPGPKVIFLLSFGSLLGSAMEQATVEDGRETEVVLHPPALSWVQGVVVDASGAAVPGITVEVEEFFRVDPAKLHPTTGNTEELNVGAGGGGGGGRFGGGSGFRGSSSSYSYMLSPDGIRFSHGAGTDGNGHFRLALKPDAAVTLTLRRGAEKILQESIVPSADPLRLVIPILPEPEKK